MRKLASLVLCTVISVSVGCSGLPQARSWEYVQSVGGLRIGEPTRVSGEWTLPITANVAGQFVTVKPTTGDSALGCSIRVTIDGQYIYVTVVTSLVTWWTESICPEASLGNVSPGRYVVLYRGPDNKDVRLGEVSIPR